MTHPTTTDPQDQLRSTFEQLLAAMCERPQDCRVTLSASSRRPALVVAVNSCDYGAILGKAQSTLHALQLLATVAAQRSGMAGASFYLDAETTGNDKSDRGSFTPAKDWDSEPLEKLANLFLPSIVGECQVTISAVTGSTSRLTVTVTGHDWVSDEDESGTVEAALAVVFNRVGSLQGRKMLVEVCA